VTISEDWNWARVAAPITGRVALGGAWIFDGAGSTSRCHGIVGLCGPFCAGRSG
jgi:hypothetical protein